MDNFFIKLKKNIRLFVQISFAALTNGYVEGFIKGKIYRGDLKKICVPGLNCYSCPGAKGSCPIGSLQNVIGSEHKFPFYIVGFLMIVGALLGRFVCGWLCPFGLVQDLLYKIPFVKKFKNLHGDKWLRYIKYIILTVFVIILPMFVVDIAGQGAPWFCKYICPSGTLMGGWILVALNEGLREVIGFLFVWKSFILIILILLSIAIYRPFCKYICPLGAIYGLFNPISFYRFNVDNDKCTKCGLCQEKCPMDIPVYLKPNSMECIRCGICKGVCPQKAIKNTSKKIMKREG